MLLGARLGMSGSEPSPLHTVTGIYSDLGNAYCVLPHIHTNPTSARVEVEFTFIKAFSRTYHISKNLFGDSVNDTKWLCNDYWGESNGYIDMQLYAGTGYVGFGGLKPSAGDKFSMVAYREGNTYVLSISKNGTSLGSKAGTSTTPMTLGRLGVFTQNNAGAGNGISPISNRVPRYVSINKFKYWDGGVMCADLLPVLDDSGVACFFDLVSNDYIYSNGSSNFIAQE